MTALAPGSYILSPGEYSLTVEGVTPPPAAAEIGLFQSAQTPGAARSLAAQLGVAPKLARVTVYPTYSTGTIPPNTSGWRNQIWMTQAQMAAFAPLSISMAYGGSSIADLLNTGSALARQAQAAGLTHVMHRPWWEMQGSWMAWNALGPATIAQGIAQLVPMVKAIDPTSVVVFNPNGAPTPTWEPYEPAEYDAIGFDFYDKNGNGTPAQLGGWAQQRGKPWGACEYGVNLRVAGNDPAAFIAGAAGAFSSPYPALFQHLFSYDPGIGKGIDSDITQTAAGISAYQAAFA